MPPPCGTYRDCADREDGYYPDLETKCGSYYVCSNGVFSGHTLCPEGKLPARLRYCYLRSVRFWCIIIDQTLFQNYSSYITVFRNTKAFRLLITICVSPFFICYDSITTETCRGHFHLKCFIIIIVIIYALRVSCTPICRVLEWTNKSLICYIYKYESKTVVSCKDLVSVCLSV